MIAFVDALPDAAVLTRDKWSSGGVEMVVANARFAQLLGYAPAELVGRNTRIFHGPKTDLAPSSGGGPARLSGENWLQRKDGTEFFASWNYGPLEGGWLIGICRDLSENKQLEDAVLHSEKLSTVGQLAGGIAHDFNNLLSIINGYCEILRSKLGSRPAAQKDLQEIHRAGLKAASIARQLLEFSRRQESKSSVVSPNTLIREIGDIIRRIMGESVQLEFRLASDLANVRVDPTQYQQALLNLCFNARDAMPQGGNLTVRTSRADFRSGPIPAGLEARAYTLTQVVDTGRGFDAETAAHLFQPFHTTKVHGTGLGLATVRTIMRRAGGEVIATGAPGEGATFELYLPETAEAEEVQSSFLGTVPVTRGSETVWVVEADEVLRKMVTGILSVDGYKVREFATPTEAIKAPAGRAQVHLLLVDGRGREACKLARFLHGRFPHVKVLFLASESPSAQLSDFPEKALGHLPKPFAISTLLRVIRTLLDTRASGR